jgi:hypothetical protein
MTKLSIIVCFLCFYQDINAMENKDLSVIPVISQQEKKLKNKVKQLKQDKDIITYRYRTIQVIAYGTSLLTALLAIHCNNNSHGIIDNQSNNTFVHAIHYPKNPSSITIESSSQFIMGCVSFGLLSAADCGNTFWHWYKNRKSENKAIV